jgi:signal transduction histidine kinase
VRFDDRLLTVLSQPAGDRHDAAVRWRQLVDLVARAGPGSSSPVVAFALETIRRDAPNIDEDVRAAAGRAAAARPLPIGLLEYFISDRLSVSAPVLAAATLDSLQWRALLDAAGEETRQFIEALHSDITAAVREPAAAPVKQQPEPSVEPAKPETPPQLPSIASPAGGPSLSEVVARIERRRRGREARRSESDAPLPAEAPSLFRWECGPSGDIAWVDGAPRGALIGRSIARVQQDDSDRVDEEVVRAFAMRAPFRDADMTVAGEGLVAGPWKISGLPAFEPTDGRFAGYRGIALRQTPEPVRRERSEDILADPDSLRELVHEIKTPLNAIIGFAEIIEGQYLGPAHHRYRNRAAEIVAQARLLLSAIDDLDFAAKIHSSAGTSRPIDLAELVDRVTDSLAAAAASRNIELEFAQPSGPCLVALEPEIAERLLMRLVNVLIDRASAGEHLRITADQSDAQCRLSISRPAALRNVPDRLVFEGVAAPADKPEASGLSAGFSLRLVRGLARIAGGDLVSSPTSLALVFPRA